MHRDGDRHKLFNRRIAILAGGKVLLLSALAGRMYYLQVIESDIYTTLADENRISLRLLPPPRGHILDRNGVALAENRQNYRVVLIPQQTPEVEPTLQSLDSIIGVGPAERRRIRREIQSRRRFVPITVRENLTWEEVAQIEVNAPDLPGIMIDVGQSRYYPHGSNAAHVLGYVAAVSESEITDDPLLQLPGFRIGKAGVEKLHDLALRGTGGASKVEVNAFGRMIREISTQEGLPGAEVMLTVDLELQRLASERLAEESGAVVVMDIHSGDILAMTSSPSFDPNTFNNGLSTEEWAILSTNPRAPLINKAIAGQYAPGSAFKMVVALAALEKGVVTTGSRVTCTGSVELGTSEFHCWRKGGHGSVNLHHAVSRSCDVYFYEIARRTGIDRIAAMARRFGLGDKLGFDLPGERAGLVPTKDWKLGSQGIPWQAGETLLTGIGQGYILTTPLQLAAMTARLANGGFAVTPRVTRTVSAAGPQSRGGAIAIGLDARHLKAIQSAMTAVVNSSTGTAFKARIKDADRAMAGKTGTVQVRRIGKAEREQGVRKNEDLPWVRRDHAVFVGYAPLSKPRYAVSVVVEHGGSGSTVAAPIARDVLAAVQRLERSRSRGTTRAPAARETTSAPAARDTTAPPRSPGDEG